MSTTPVDKMEMILCAAQRPKAGGMAFYPLTTSQGEDVRLIFGAVGTFPSYVPFEPSIFGGNGGEPRKAIRFAITEEALLNSVLDVETKAKALLDDIGIKYTWTSAITEAKEPYPPMLKCKIWVTGERSATVRNEAGEPIPMPTQPWPRPRANAMIEARGIYRMNNGNTGLILQVAALHLANQNFGSAPDPFMTT